MASLLDRIGQGLVSFGSGVPQAQIDTIRADRDLSQQAVEVGQQQIDVESQRAAQEQEIQSLIGVAMGDGPDRDRALNRLFQINPEIGDKIFEGIGAISGEQREDAARRAAEVQSTPPDQREAVIMRQAQDLIGQGRNPKDTLSLLEQSPEDQDNSLRFIQAAALSAKERVSGVQGGSSKLGQSVVVKDPKTGELSFATPVLTDNVVSTQQTPISGSIVSRQAGETSGERQQRDIDTAGGKSTAVAVSKRDQEFITVGQRQADASAIIRRGLELLDVVGTGRPDAIALAAKDLFGIAGADETELNANLGKAILSQLRETFGAQFTENEGKRLESIESNFGKSTAGNKRLLNQALKSMERDARRGIDSARRNKDAFSMQEIQNALEFSLSIPSDENTEEAPSVDPQLLEFMTPEERKLFN